MNVACSICLESFTLTSDIYTTPCGHVFHHKCIRKWLESGHPHCSQCRQDCSIVEIVKLYFSENESALENNNLCTQLESENLKLQQEVNALKARRKDLEEENKKLHTAFCQSRCSCAAMDRVLKVQRSEINSKNQKISELEAKCNQIAIPAGSTEGSVKETGSSAGGTGSNILAFLRVKGI